MPMIAFATPIVIADEANAEITVEQRVFQSVSRRENRCRNAPEHQFHDRTVIVTQCGRLCFGGRKINLSQVFAGQAVVYVVRERGRMWGSQPVMPMMLFSLADIAIVSSFALSGTLMRSLPLNVVILLLVATAAFALALDQVKVMLLARCPID